MKRVVPIVLLAVVVLFCGGCAQVGGLVDGMTGRPIAEIDSPGWYHAGQMLMPVISQIAALVRIWFATSETP